METRDFREKNAGFFNEEGPNGESLEALSAAVLTLALEEGEGEETQQEGRFGLEE